MNSLIDVGPGAAIIAFRRFRAGRSDMDALWRMSGVVVLVMVAILVAEWLGVSLAPSAAFVASQAGGVL